MSPSASEVGAKVSDEPGVPASSRLLAACVNEMEISNAGVLIVFFRHSLYLEREMLQLRLRE